MADVLPSRRKYEAVTASDTSLDPETEAFQPLANLHAHAVLARVDHDSYRRCGAQEMRDLGQHELEGLKRVAPNDQADGVLRTRDAPAHRRHTKVSATAEIEVDIRAIAPRDNDTMQA
jgi:hypothetical protein